MKTSLVSGFVVALCTAIFSNAALGYDLVCEDIFNNYKLTVHFSQNPGSGQVKADSAELTMNGSRYASFDNCVLTKGAKTTLHCGSPNDWEIKATLSDSFDPGNLTRARRLAGTLVCKP